MKIYTKTGDDGTTGLFGGGRVAKNSLRIEAYGTIDEVNSLLGIARSHDSKNVLQEIISRLQVDLFVLGADLATPLEAKVTYSIPRVDEKDVARLERWIDENEAQLPPLKKFILPGGCPLAAALHNARTVVRRGERILVSLSAEEEIGPSDLQFVNRLSDLLFVLARRANQEYSISDIEWDGKKGE